MTPEQLHIQMRQFSLFDWEDISEKELNFIDRCAENPIGYEFTNKQIEMMEYLFNKYKHLTNKCGCNIFS